ncbi:MAG: hypothetical protein ACOVO1_08590 [Chitinophagaceae bacterium]
MKEQEEIIKEFRQQQEKFIYYLIALCVASIAFAVHQTNNKQLAFTQIPLGVAVICWGISIYSGFKFIAKTLDLLYINNDYFNLLQGKNDIAGRELWKIEVGKEAFESIMNMKSKRASKFSKLQINSFYFGSLAFIVWHIIEMYLAI